MSKKITVIGSSNIDLILKLNHLPKPGETVCDGNFMQTFGGKGANQAVAAARAGGNVTFITCVGDDNYGYELKEYFKQTTMNIDNIHTAINTPTGTALIFISDDGENSIGVAPGANSLLCPDQIDSYSDTIQSSNLILLQMEIPEDTINKILVIAKKLKIPVIMNYAPIRNFNIEIDDSIFGLIVNETEATSLTGIDVKDMAGVTSAAFHLLSKGLQFVIITLGAGGAYISDKSGLSTTIPAFTVKPVDTTAAGDTFCGALSVALTEGNELVDAVKFANAASAIAVTRIGAQPSIPYRDEIDSFLDKQ
jgi:ribokinase